jgi:hypothetical protein
MIASGRIRVYQGSAYNFTQFVRKYIKTVREILTKTGIMNIINESLG